MRVSEEYLSELLQVEFKRLHVHVKTQSGHGKQDVLSINGLAFLLMASLAGLRCDEADELAYTLLHTLFCILGYLRLKRVDKRPLLVFKFRTLKKTTVS